jgi:hypothetical protein
LLYSINIFKIKHKYELCYSKKYQKDMYAKISDLLLYDDHNSI